MRQIIFLAFFVITTISFAQDETTSRLTWLTNLDEAKKASKEQDKPILVYFTGSDWSSPCKALKTDFFETDDFVEKSEELILVMVDYPRRMDIITEEQREYNKTVISKYNKSKTFPKLVMLNSRGNEIGELSGYSSFNTYKDISHHVAFVDKYL